MQLLCNSNNAQNSFRLPNELHFFHVEASLGSLPFLWQAGMRVEMFCYQKKLSKQQQQ